MMQMNKRCFSALLVTVFAGCAGMNSEVPNDTVVKWTQRKEEAGMLAVGKIATVEKVNFQRDRPRPTPAITSVQAGLITAVMMPVAEAIRNADWFYRYSVQMKSGDIRVFELNYVFKVGDCIALRPGLSPDSVGVIPALAGQCD